MNETMVQQEGFAARCQKVLQVAKELFQGKPDWVTFFRETLGVSGAARSVFPTQAEYVMFEKSNEYVEIQNMVLALRNRKMSGGGANEPTKVITVRLPESLHEALKAEASDHNTSMNKLCISKLLQVLIDNPNQAAPVRAAAAAMAAKPMSPAMPQSNMPSAPNFRSTFHTPTNPAMAPNTNKFGQ
ncbi:MAG: toxin-antitoxin system HicB family antitoxin [Planctomycetota bacterium]|nr:toxin-antitoxin system HicB family antitoxin [Planctomycetota bacterium]